MFSCRFDSCGSPVKTYMDSYSCLPVCLFACFWAREREKNRHGLILVFLCFLSILVNHCFVRPVSIQPSNFLCQSKEWGTFFCSPRISLLIRHNIFHLTLTCIPLLDDLGGCEGGFLCLFVCLNMGPWGIYTYTYTGLIKMFPKWWVVYSVLFVCRALVCLFAALITCTFLHNTSVFACCGPICVAVCLFVMVWLMLSLFASLITYTFLHNTPHTTSPVCVSMLWPIFCSLFVCLFVCLLLLGIKEVLKLGLRAEAQLQDGQNAAPRI